MSAMIRKERLTYRDYTTDEAERFYALGKEKPQPNQTAKPSRITIITGSIYDNSLLCRQPKPASAQYHPGGASFY